jgi:hypothetical protein
MSRLVLGLCVFQVAVAQFFMNIGGAQHVLVFVSTGI